MIYSNALILIPIMSYLDHLLESESDGIITKNGTPLNWVSWLYDSKHNMWVCEWTLSRCQIDELF